MVQAVIFDMDGTLIDTEKYYRIYWRQALESFGYHPSEEQILSMRSLGRPYAQRRLREWFGPELDYLAVRALRRELMEERLKQDGVACKPGAVELLKQVKELGITTAVATATDLERTHRYLLEAGLEKYIDRFISATQVELGKPAPDIYKYACEQLGVRPKECLAVEDSPNGVLSAYRAGCRVIMVPDQTEPDEELKKCLFACVDRLDKVRDYL